ncbi:type II secretion system F family protein [Haloactinopolyspora sp.]|uniref:type II secretion system F family protein n=1 Tax=Haloactinopolyspora sp. TaxID=1966353 RepID=UPI002623BA74|nr:type II secretion system F family protein [Haloactinopolyspora sp.]
MTAAAVVLAAAAAAVLAGGRPRLLATRLGLGETQPPRARRGQVRTGAEVVVVAGVLGAGLGITVAGPGGLMVGGFAPLVIRRWWRRRAAAEARRRRERDVEEACVALAGELDSGVPARQALTSVAHQWPDLFADAAGRAMVGGDPAAAVRASAHQPGAEALVAVAAAWEVSERTGAGLSAVLVTVADSLRAEAGVRREAYTHLASVRTTARLMAVLPVATLMLFSAGEGAALEFLTRSVYGLGCIAAAAVFVAAGLFWVDRAAKSVRSVWQT